MMMMMAMMILMMMIRTILPRMMTTIPLPTPMFRLLASSLMLILRLQLEDRLSGWVVALIVMELALQECLLAPVQVLKGPWKILRKVRRSLRRNRNIAARTVRTTLLRNLAKFAVPSPRPLPAVLLLLVLLVVVVVVKAVLWWLVEVGTNANALCTAKEQPRRTRNAVILILYLYYWLWI